MDLRNPDLGQRKFWILDPVPALCEKHLFSSYQSQKLLKGNCRRRAESAATEFIVFFQSATSNKSSRSRSGLLVSYFLKALTLFLLLLCFLTWDFKGFSNSVMSGHVWAHISLFPGLLMENRWEENKKYNTKEELFSGWWCGLKLYVIISTFFFHNILIYILKYSHTLHSEGDFMLN